MEQKLARLLSLRINCTIYLYSCPAFVLTNSYKKLLKIKKIRGQGAGD